MGEPSPGGEETWMSCDRGERGEGKRRGSGPPVGGTAEVRVRGVGDTNLVATEWGAGARGAQEGARAGRRGRFKDARGDAGVTSGPRPAG